MRILLAQVALTVALGFVLLVTYPLYAQQTQPAVDITYVGDHWVVNIQTDESVELQVNGFSVVRLDPIATPEPTRTPVIPPTSPPRQPVVPPTSPPRGPIIPPQ